MIFPTFLNKAQVSHECFDRTKAWLYQRINHNQVNNKDVGLTLEQKQQLKIYLQDKQQELNQFIETL